MGPESSTTVRFILERCPAAWHVYLFIALAVVLVWWIIRRYGPRPPGFVGGLAMTCRVLAVLAVIALLAGPAWLSVTTVRMPGNLVVAVDRSLSMAREDGPGDKPRIAMAAELYQVLSAEDVPDRRVSWVTVGGVSGPLDPSADNAFDAIGDRSPLAREVEDLAASYRPDLVVLVSDARSTDGVDVDAASSRLLRGQVAVWPLLVGGDGVDRELRLDEVEGPSDVAMGERQPFTLVVGGRSLEAGVPVELEVTAGDVVLATASVTAPATDDPVANVEFRRELSVVLEEEGEVQLQFTARQGDAESTVTRTVQVGQRRLTVLMLAHRPRFEMRYLRAALERDLTVDCHSYLGDGRWRRWGDRGPEERLPLTPLELREYDAILIGDIHIDQFDDNQQAAIEQAVRANGAGLIWVPGSAGHTASFRNTALGKLLPATLPDGEVLARQFLEDRPRLVRRTDLASRLGLLDSGDTDWGDLPPLRSTLQIDRLRGNAGVLMEDLDEVPVVVVGDYGNGRSILVGTDDTWRWRRNVGDTFLHRFYSQLFRHAVEGRQLGRRPWRVEASPFRTIPGAEVALNLIRSGAEEDPSRLPQEVTAQLSGPDDQQRLVTLRRLDDGPGYVTRLPAPGLGIWSVGIIDGLRPADVAPGELTVVPPAGEFRDSRANPLAAQSLATGTGGQVFTNAEDLVAALPALGRTDEHPLLTPVWDRWWVLAVILGLLAIEWSLRRAYRLP